MPLVTSVIYVLSFYLVSLNSFILYLSLFYYFAFLRARQSPTTWKRKLISINYYFTYMYLRFLEIQEGLTSLHHTAERYSKCTATSLLTLSHLPSHFLLPLLSIITESNASIACTSIGNAIVVRRRHRLPIYYTVF